MKATAKQIALINKVYGGVYTAEDMARLTVASASLLIKALLPYINKWAKTPDTHYQFFLWDRLVSAERKAFGHGYSDVPC